MHVERRAVTHSFPINRYTLDLMQLSQSKDREIQELRSRETGAAAAGDMVCGEHSKPWALFCADLSCLTMLCPLCPIQQHSSHALVGVTENLRGSLATDLVHIHTDAATEALKEHLRKVELAQAAVSTARETATEDVNKRLEELVKEAEGLKQAISKEAEDKIKELEQIKTNTEKQLEHGEQIQGQISACPDRTVETSHVDFVRLAENVKSHLDHVNTIVSSTPVTMATTFTPAVTPPGGSALGSLAWVPVTFPHQMELEEQSERVAFWDDDADQ